MVIRFLAIFTCFIKKERKKEKETLFLISIVSIVYILTLDNDFRRYSIIFRYRHVFLIIFNTYFVVKCATKNLKIG